MVKSLGFVEGMLVGPSMPKCAGGDRVFDWIRAAEIIKKEKPKVAEAGLEEDWNCTAGYVWRDGKPVPKDETYTYLASRWATPILRLDDGKEIECWVFDNEEGNPHKFNEKTYWPDVALKIIRKRK